MSKFKFTCNDFNGDPRSVQTLETFVIHANKILDKHLESCEKVYVNERQAVPAANLHADNFKYFDQQAILFNLEPREKKECEHPGFGICDGKLTCIKCFQELAPAGGWKVEG